MLDRKLYIDLGKFRKKLLQNDLYSIIQFLNKEYTQHM